MIALQNKLNIENLDPLFELNVMEAQLQDEVFLKYGINDDDLNKAIDIYDLINDEDFKRQL